jgi:hypothetical protein
MNMHLFLRPQLWALFGLSLLTAAVQAQPSGGDQGGPDGGRRHGPPPEAIAACKGKTAGADCSFTGRHDDTLTGTCFAPPAHPAGLPSDQSATSSPSGKSSDLPLACRPARGGPGGGPPQH